MPSTRLITTRNAQFQQWEALLTNRSKRQHSREFLVQGVRPITLAIEHGWRVANLLHDAEREPSSWAENLLRTVRAPQVAMSAELLAELGEKEHGAPELVAVVEIPADDLERIPVGDDFLGVLFDRPASPGNLGSVLRSSDAFGAGGVVVTGHAADVYDPRTVRASTGSLFALPTVRVSSPHDVDAWLDAHRGTGRSVRLVGTDEAGDVDVFDADLTGPTFLLVGNETAGLSAAWRQRCDLTVRIPIAGAATSLNAANAASVVLYEAARQRQRAEGLTAPEEPAP